MKRITLFLAFVLSLGCAAAFAQDNNTGKKPVVKLGTLAPNNVVDGKMTPTYATTDRITRQPDLNTDVAGSEVTGFKFSLKAASGAIWGPVTVIGSKLTGEIIAKVKATRGPDVKVYIDDIHVKYNGKNVMANSIMLKYDQ